MAEKGEDSKRMATAWITWKGHDELRCEPLRHGTEGNETQRNGPESRRLATSGDGEVLLGKRVNATARSGITPIGMAKAELGADALRSEQQCEGMEVERTARARRRKD